MTKKRICIIRAFRKRGIAAGSDEGDRYAGLRRGEGDGNPSGGLVRGDDCNDRSARVCHDRNVSGKEIYFRNHHQRCQKHTGRKGVVLQGE